MLIYLAEPQSTKSVNKQLIFLGHDKKLIMSGVHIVHQNLQQLISDNDVMVAVRYNAPMVPISRDVRKPVIVVSVQGERKHSS